MLSCVADFVRSAHYAGARRINASKLAGAFSARLFGGVKFWED